ncbi:hypothetical protein FRB96_007344 [Tulasnella sp. 330]|nr:hypothetical protein FRB96_007344 [Tulasnella sp. 330]
MEVNAAISAYIFLVLRIPACEKFSIAVTILKYTFISEAQQHHTSVLTSQVAFAAVISISFSEQGLCYEASEGGSIYLKAPESLTDSLALHLPKACKSSKAKAAIKKLKKLVDTLDFSWSSPGVDRELSNYVDNVSVSVALMKMTGAVPKTIAA